MYKGAPLEGNDKRNGFFHGRRKISVIDFFYKLRVESNFDQIVVFGHFSPHCAKRQDNNVSTNQC
jgi:hypothetical protein